MICLLAGLRYLFASCVAIAIRPSFLVGLLFVFCSVMIIRWLGSIVVWLTIAFFCDYDAPAILDLLCSSFRKIFAYLAIFLLMAVSRQLLFSCSSETALVLLAVLTRSSLILLNVFIIFFEWCFFLRFYFARDCCSRSTPSFRWLEPMIIVS